MRVIFFLIVPLLSIFFCGIIQADSETEPATVSGNDSNIETPGTGLSSGDEEHSSYGSSQPGISSAGNDSQSSGQGERKCQHSFCNSPCEPGSNYCSAHQNMEENKGDGWNCPECGWWVNAGSPCNNPACSRSRQGEVNEGSSRSKRTPGSSKNGSIKQDETTAGSNRDFPAGINLSGEELRRYIENIFRKTGEGFFLPSRRKHRGLESIF